MSDPFRHHPGLRGKITPAAESFWREFNHHKLEAMLRENGLPTGWWFDDATREATRHAALDGRRDRDLWVFAYGSLMWDPAFEFVEVRRAYVPGYRRRFILLDVLGGRGTEAQPGLMAALDLGDGCAGLALRIAAERVDMETEILWRREMLAECYTAEMVTAELDTGPVEALTFVADHQADMIAHDLTRAQQLDYITTGQGFLGTSYDYLKGVVEHLHDLDVPDPHLDALFEDARRWRAQKE